MSTALLLKTARDSLVPLALVFLASVFFPCLMMHALSGIDIEAIQPILQTPWIAGILRALTGVDITEGINTYFIGAFAFVHPVILTLIWSYLIATATRTLSGEIDQGTVDLLLSLPLSRGRVYVTVAVWVLLAAPLLVGGLVLGIRIGEATAGLPEPVTTANLLNLALGACALHAAVAGLSLCCAAAGSRRGSIVGLIFGILLTSFLLNILAAFWPKAQAVAVVGILHYFRPFEILRDGAPRTADAIVLFTVAAVTITIGAVIFRRRDIHVT